MNAAATLDAAAARVHDLLQLRGAHGVHWDAAAPEWAIAALAAAPWVVVRRAAPRDGCLAVGVRGARRWQRAAAWLAPRHAAALLTPAALRGRVRGLAPARRRLPVFRALHRLETAWDCGGPADWGPGGSAGFELASGTASAGPLSDLDIVVRCAREPALQHARAWWQALPESPQTRIDVLLEWPAGAASLAEYVAGGSYLLRAADGASMRRHACGEETA